MQQPATRWLFVLIGLVIIIVVGSVVLFSTRVANQTAVNTNTTATPNHALGAASAMTATVQANVTTPTPATGNKTVFSDSDGESQLVGY